MKLFYKVIFVIAFHFIGSKGFSQGTCPDNIGFEFGSFKNWNCFAGIVAADGTIGGLTGPSPATDRHTIIQNTIPQTLDPYGHFPINCPNGSNYSIRLGNESTGGQADRVSYTFTVPLGKDEYSIIYNYAIVFQNPNHLPDEQPRFTSKVYDETAGQYLGCGAFEFVASSGLPGFQLSDVGQSVFYKPWAPVTVKLMGCAGKKITLEFTVNDCSRGGHFGYAYLDVNENCSSPITGNVYCNGATSVTLSAPFGFKEYNWYTADFSTLLGTNHTLHLDPIPPVGTVFALEIIPYPGLGCLDTLYTKIELSPEAFHFALLDTLTGCLGYPADITLRTITSGSSPGLAFSYFVDSIGLEYLPTPSYVSTEGTYYIKAVNISGCTETKPLYLKFKDTKLVITDPPDNCSPNSVDLTAPAVTAGSDAGISFSYWKNDIATIPLTNPAAVTEKGTYYIRALNANCSIVGGVNVRIWAADNLKVNPIATCSKADLTDYSVTAGSTPVFTFSQWMNAQATIPVPDAKNISTSGTYYIKAATVAGCSFIKPVTVTIQPPPDFIVTDPAVVTAPEMVNITKSIFASQTYDFSYWLNDSSTRALLNPSAISKPGTYFIMASDSLGCFTVKPVTVTILIPPDPIIKYPNTFSPNKDGINDGFRVDVVGNVSYRFLKIYDRWGQVVFETRNPFEYWDGQKNGKPLPVGTYYWIMELVNNTKQEFYRRSGNITLIR